MRLLPADQPCLEAGHLLLRRWLEEDAEAIVEAYHDPDIRRWHVRSMGLEEARAWTGEWARRWAECEAASWAVVDSAGLVGRAGIQGLSASGRRAEVAFWTVARARCQGVATRATGRVVEWVFDATELHRLELVHSVRNTSSCRVAAHLRFDLEGTMRQHGLHDDGWHDMHLHALLRL